MANQIPLLRDLIFGQIGYDVAAGFARQFLALHDDNWRSAEAHWERAVARALNSNAVGRKARGSRALRKAVQATSSHLNSPLMRERCPFCQNPRP
jgi:hypothetical protein